jgi:hypothetical protein
MAWQPAPMTFGTPAKAGPGAVLDAPPGLTCKQLARRGIMLAEAKKITEQIPKPGEAVHAIMTGRYDLMHVVIAILAQSGQPCKNLRLATLGYNRRNLVELCRLIDTGATKKLALICSKFFQENSKELYQATQAEFRARGARVAAPRSHCKVICFDFGKTALLLEGSANLRTNGNWEQFALIHDRKLHDWHAKWIDDLLAKHEAK